ncbi:hypothetical protein Q7C36_005905 [Tachysurus vachellii]|uniref:Uncharacterized protein n=1 Tax=Tachysurus vachellii TaxID=175792 RepID=A0AA88NEU7_TACVA|nr:hypothetical protein Q7C36_005905 [Tachysurus vachellii]
MARTRYDVTELQEEEPQAGGSALTHGSGTWREETPSDLLPPTELHYNTVENEDNDEDYSPDQLYAQSTSKHFHGKRTREQLSEKEEVEEAPPSKRQRMEQEDVVVELLSSSSLSLSPILDPIPSIDMHPRNENMADEEENDEEAPPRTRQHVEQEDELSELTNLDSNSSTSLTLSPTLEFIPIIDSSSSSHYFWWRWRVSDREQISGEEDNDGETPPERLEHVEQEDNENEVYFVSLERSPSPSMNLSTTSDFMLFIVDSSGNDTARLFPPSLRVRETHPWSLGWSKGIAPMQWRVVTTMCFLKSLTGWKGSVTRRRGEKPCLSSAHAACPKGRWYPKLEELADFCEHRGKKLRLTCYCTSH